MIIYHNQIFKIYILNAPQPVLTTSNLKIGQNWSIFIKFTQFFAQPDPQFVISYEKLSKIPLIMLKLTVVCYILINNSYNLPHK